MGGVGAGVIFAAREPLECKGPFKLFLELAENPTIEREDQTPHNAQGG